MIYEHGDSIIATDLSGKTTTLYVVNPSAPFLQRLKVAWKLIIGAAR
jgi:hypothetical protein